MKILFLTRYYLPHVGGIEQNIFKISSYLKEGNDITVMTVKGSGLPLREEMHGVNVVRRPYLDFLHEDLHKYNVVFLENFNLLLIILIIVNICLSTMIKKKKYRLVFVPHGGFTPYWEIFRPVVRFIKKTIHRTIGIFFVNSFVEKVVAVSTWEQNELRQVGVTKPILLIGNGFETMPISKDVIKGKYIIFVGRIDKIKNLEGMIIMFSKLLKSNFFRGWKLHIIGNSPRDVEYVEKLKKLSEETGVIDSVCFFGVVRGEEIMLATSNRGTKRRAKRREAPCSNDALYSWLPFSSSCS